MLSLQAWKDRITEDPIFLPFKQMFQHEPLLKWIYYEKCRFPGSLPKSRLIVDSTTGEAIGGYTTKVDMPADRYAPDAYEPITLTGIWLPLHEGTLYSTLPKPADCPLIQKDAKGQDHILYLIHPASLHLYQTLLANPAASIISVPALSLSSFRTVLVALPQPSGEYTPVIVKLSLDQQINGVVRLLSRRECRLTVGNSLILKQKMQDLPNCNLFEDPLSFVPNGYEHGMIYRVLPDFLNPACENPRGQYAMPLLALYGIRNCSTLAHLIAQNGGTATHFLTHCLLEPFAELWCKLLLERHASIEAHGQNLLLMLDGEDHVTGLLYRDMGGVNQLFSPAEWTALPHNLQDPSVYYGEMHVQDAANALEDHFVRYGLFPLTKQLVKSTALRQQDSALSAWYDNCKQAGFLPNWTTSETDTDTDEHVTRLTSDCFFRYGYVEHLFAACLIRALETAGRIDATTREEMQAHFYQPERLPDGTLVAPCSYIPFFQTQVTQLLTHQALHQDTTPRLSP